MKRILITGASSGIGAATALHLDRCGMEVFAAVRSLDDGEDALAGASDRLRRISLDVTDAGSIAEAMATVGGAGLDGLVNNAGIGVPGPLELLSTEDLRRQLDVNVVGQVAVTQAALPLLRTAAGRIVFVGSVGGQARLPVRRGLSRLEVRDGGDRRRLAAGARPRGDRGDPDRAERDLDADLGQGGGADRRAARGRRPARGRYRDRLQEFRESLRSADEHGKSPDDVAAAIEQALTEDSPDTRYVVGAAGKVATALRPLIPDRLADKLAERA